MEKAYNLAMIYTSKNEKETQKIAAELSQNLKSLKFKKSIIVALEGELGAGKTVFTKGLARVLGVREKIKSPTFVLMRKYKLVSKRFKNLKFLYHLDCYRLKDENDLINLGIKEILQVSHNIVVIEWADRVKKILPKKHIKIHIDHIDKNTRKIEIISKIKDLKV